MSEQRKIFGLNTSIIIVWLIASVPTFVWVWQTLTHDDHRMNLYLLAMIVGVLAMRLKEVKLTALIYRPPCYSSFGSCLSLLGASLYLVGENYLDIDIASALGFALLSLGLLRFYLDSPVWRRAILPVLILVGVLPFQFHLEAYVGFPLRVGIAKTVSWMLGLEAQATSTILAYESQLASVDLPCSGLKSLWVGLLFILSTSILMNLHLGWRWLVSSAAGIGLLLAMNLARVLFLSQLILNFGVQAWIEMIHVPLGMMAFVIACGLYAMLCRYWLRPAIPVAHWRSGNALVFRPFAVSLLVLSLVIGLHRPFEKLHAQPNQVEMPRLIGLAQNQIDLTPAELDLFSRFEAVRVGKYRVDQPDIKGSMLVSRSRHWRAHHNPEQCFRGNGISMSHTSPVFIGDKPVRAVVDHQGAIVGLFWFQSNQSITDDFSERIFSSFWSDEKDWVMVTLLFETPRKLALPVEDFVLLTQQTLSHWLNSEEGPNI